MTEEQELYVNELNKMINQFILHSKKFVEWSAFSYGAADLLRVPEPNNKFTYDHEYFNFTKSTKTLISIRSLLKMGHNEDVLILVRSIFENYLSSRYLNENEGDIKNFTLVNLKLFFREYVYDFKENVIKDRNGEKISERLNPSEFKLGDDKKYYSLFYDLLSSVGHSNFGTSNFYVDESLGFTLNKNNYPVVTRFFVIFVFTKLFELIVTVEGEDFYNTREEEVCYNLVIDSLIYQDNLIIQLIDAISRDTATNPKKSKYFNKKMIEMFKAMRKSLREELGSVKKEFLD
ncbi:DUF5677 domain-containing protein [Oceanobacillus halophilus]|uniref:Uncharacterized protein n=1 Tax=Oceanobacillus halophilus TaxID=930130 RepID=A0A495A7C7_9BACI|nr:DUF5677 domain-containing protein [Oceanobacillus halophilus]RKQ34264.1 hypothetical protein D8M06_07740 [Oceanobacillus halophilus]